MGLSSRNTWFAYRWGTGEEFELPEGHTTVLRKSTQGGYVPLAFQSMTAGAVRFAANRLP